MEAKETRGLNLAGQESRPQRVYSEAALYKQLSYYHRWRC
jgi:hypothetical protein